MKFLRKYRSMKSSACTLFKCETNYTLRHECTGEVEQILCRCQCHKKHFFARAMGSIVAGCVAIIIGNNFLKF